MRIVFSFALFFSPLIAQPLEVAVSARSAILMNADTGAILYEKHARVPAYPASITKVATALFALDEKKLDLERKVAISGDCLKMKPLRGSEEALPHWLDVHGSKMGIQKGEILSFEDLLHGLLLVSGNDAANAIAEALSGSIPRFIEEMNLYVKKLGCLSTQFRNPHGLHHSEHFTTAYDMCLIARKALHFPKFREVVSKSSYVRPKTNKQGALELVQSNPLLKPGKHYYSKAIGIKTGYTSQALNTLVAAAEHEGRTLIAVVLGCPRRTDRYEDVIRLFEAAFQEPKQVRRFLGPEKIFSRVILGAKSLLGASLQAPLEITYYPAEEPTCRAFVHWDTSDLPIKKGQKVGEIRVVDERGALLQKGDLLARERLEGTFWHVFKEKLRNLFP